MNFGSDAADAALIKDGEGLSNSISVNQLRDAIRKRVALAAFIFDTDFRAYWDR